MISITSSIFNSLGNNCQRAIIKWSFILKLMKFLQVIPNSQNPNWNEKFYIPMAHPAAHLEFHVKDNDIFGAQLIGKVLIQAEKIAAGGSIGGWYPVIGANGGPPKPGTALRLEMTFSPCDKNPLYQHGIVSWEFSSFEILYCLNEKMCPVE